MQSLCVRQMAEFGDRLHCSLDRDIGLIGDIGFGDAVERGRPGFRTGPIEGDHGGTRDRTGNDATGLQARIHATTGLSAAADDENWKL